MHCIVESKCDPMKGLMIVDVQQDFCPGGALATPYGDKVVPVINKLMPGFNLVIASRDWHPPGSVHFEKWPVHCVRNTPGAAYHPDLDTRKFDVELVKGTNDKDDGYSAFEATNIPLAETLRRKNVDELFVCGLTTEYCVKETVLAALREGFTTYLIEDATEAVLANPGDPKKAIEEMREAGAIIVKSTDERVGE